MTEIRPTTIIPKNVSTTTTAPISCSSLIEASDRVRHAGGEGAAAINRMAKMSPTTKNGIQYAPIMVGPIGWTHAPPAHVRRNNTRKNKGKLAHGPRRPKNNEKNTVNINVMPKAMRISTAIMMTPLFPQYHPQPHHTLSPATLPYAASDPADIGSSPYSVFLEIGEGLRINNDNTFYLKN